MTTIVAPSPSTTPLPPTKRFDHHSIRTDRLILVVSSRNRGPARLQIIDIKPIPDRWIGRYGTDIGGGRSTVVDVESFLAEDGVIVLISALEPTNTS